MNEVKAHRQFVKNILLPLGVSSILSVGLFVSRMVAGGSTRYWFLLWNLVLAWLPLLFSFSLLHWLRRGAWRSWRGILLSVLWLGFLPNSFYLVSDFIHLKSTGEVSVLFDAVLFMSFAWNGLLLGFTSVLIMHSQFLKRLPSKLVSSIIAAIFVLCSFAIYLGRFLQWNTWDIILNPGGILFDISNRLVKPASYPSTFTTTALFSVTLLALYYTVFKLVAALRHEHNLRDL